MNTTRRIALAIALSLPLVPWQAIAQPAPDAKPAAAEPTKEAKEEASRRFRRGIELFQEGDSRTALVEFKRAYELAPNYQVLYNIGNVYFQLQDYANALQAFEKYLADGGAQIAAQRRSDVEKDIEKLRTRVARLNITTSVPDAEVIIDDAPAGKTPFSKPVIVNPGSHKITAIKEGRQTASKSIEVASFDSLNVTLDLPEQTKATPEPSASVTPPPLPTATASATPSTTTTAFPPPPPSGTPAWPFWTATAAFAVGAGVTGTMAYLKSKDLAKMRDPSTTTTRADLDAAASSTKTLALVSDILSGLTVVGLGVSIVVTASKPSAAPAKDKTGALHDVRVRVAPNGMLVTGSF